MNITINDIQKLIDGEWKYSAAAREACKNHTWKEFQMIHQPKPSFLNIISNYSYNKCLAICVENFQEPSTKEALILPVWILENRNDTPSKQWLKQYILKIENQPFYFLENSLLNKAVKERLEVYIQVKVKIWNTALLVESKYYASEIPLIKRGFPYGVMSYQIIEVETILNQSNLNLLPKPNEVVPPFGFKMLPAQENLPEHLVKEIKTYHQ